jgi:excisionase family DNA binding protein
MIHSQLSKHVQPRIEQELPLPDTISQHEPLLDCARAALLLGGVHPKTVQKWAREGRIPAYRFFKRWCFRASELEVWLSSHVHSKCHPCRFQKEESDGA